MSGPSRVDSVIVFGLDEPQVDDLIQAVADRCLPVATWIVFGMDAKRLRALEATWPDANLVLCFVPDFSSETCEAALDIVHAEGRPSESLGWVLGPRARVGLPVGMGHVVAVNVNEPGDSVARRLFPTPPW